jgi:hypothetical protein
VKAQQRSDFFATFSTREGGFSIQKLLAIPLEFMVQLYANPAGALSRAARPPFGGRRMGEGWGMQNCGIVVGG